MSIWLSVDGALTVEGPDTIEPETPQTLEFRVFEDLRPAIGAKVCLYMAGEIFMTTYAGGTGVARFDINPLNPGTMTVTATKARFIPAQASVSVGTPTPVEETELLPAAPRAQQNYPNPFNHSTAIRFSLTRNDNARIDIFDITGRLVRNLASKRFPAGDNQVIWDGKNDNGDYVASGIFFYRFESGSSTVIKQMSVIK